MADGNFRRLGRSEVPTIKVRDCQAIPEGLDTLEGYPEDLRMPLENEPSHRRGQASPLFPTSPPSLVPATKAERQADTLRLRLDVPRETAFRVAWVRC